MVCYVLPVMDDVIFAFKSNAKQATSRILKLIQQGHHGFSYAQSDPPMPPWSSTEKEAESDI